MARSRRAKAKKPKEIFLSHSTLDRKFAMRLAEVLRSHGLKVWYSEKHIQGADQWHDEIGKALKRCDWFLLVLSPNALKAKWVKRETLYALRADKFDERIMPVVYKKCTDKQIDEFVWSLPDYQTTGRVGDFDATVQAVLATWGIRFKSAKKP